MNYIPVSEVEKLVKAWRKEVKQIKRDAGTAYDIATWTVLAAAANHVERLLKSATEGVTIENFEVVLIRGNLSLDESEYAKFKPCDGKTVTLVLIPDKTVVTEGEK